MLLDQIKEDSVLAVELRRRAASHIPCTQHPSHHPLHAPFPPPLALAIAPRRRVASTKEIEAALAKQTAEADKWREACNEARLAAGELEAEL